MVNVKIIAVVAAVLIVVCGAAAAVTLFSGEKKGLYQLDATVTEVNMARCSATPGVILAIEQLYRDYYGEILYDFTLEEAKADTKFWNEYGKWDPIVTKKTNGTLDVKISTAYMDKLKTTDIKNIPVCDTAVIVGTIHSETIYFLACTANDVVPYSEESFASTEIKEYMNKTITGGMQYSYFENNDIEHMVKYIEKNRYHEIGANTTPTVETERLLNALENSKTKGVKNTIFLGSGARVDSKDMYDRFFKSCEVTSSYCALFSPNTIPEIYSTIECIGLILGFDRETIDEVIQDIQVRLYNIYRSVQELTKEEAPGKVYLETYAGKAASSAMYKVIFDLLGFDTSLLDGAEHDIESLLKDQPSYIVFFTNDYRSMDEKMRTKT